MKKTLILFTVITSTILIIGCQSDEYKKISEDELRNKIAGGWAGKMIGVSYGAPTEFEYNGVINEDPINWNPASLRKSIGQDEWGTFRTACVTTGSFQVTVELCLQLFTFRVIPGFLVRLYQRDLGANHGPVDDIKP